MFMMGTPRPSPNSANTQQMVGSDVCVRQNHDAVFECGSRCLLSELNHLHSNVLEQSHALFVSLVDCHNGVLFICSPSSDPEDLEAP